MENKRIGAPIIERWLRGGQVSYLPAHTQKLQQEEQKQG